jgi:hypothetical protein
MNDRLLSRMFISCADVDENKFGDIDWSQPTTVKSSYQVTNWRIEFIEL